MSMVEVFKTDVIDRDKADFLVSQVQNNFDQYRASFDLEDCDRILVVKCATGIVHTLWVIDLLKSFECRAEVLPDEG
jgi:hypothetical protein